MTERLEPEAVGRDDKSELRLWLRFLRCYEFIEREIRGQLRSRFGVSLSRFDYMAQLDRAGAEGLSMGEIGKRLMVTGGNITGLTARLEEEDLVARRVDSVDRRIQRVVLTAKGRALFAEMAAAHAVWIKELFSELEDGEIRQLMELLTSVRHSAQNAVAAGLVPKAFPDEGNPPDR